MESPASQPWSRTEGLLALALLLAAALLRFVNLQANPPGLFRDEMEKGYTAWELWETGRHGVLGAQGVTESRLLPLFIEVYEGHDRTSAVYQYISAPIVGILGLERWTTRLVAALAGTASALLVWLLARRLMGATAGLVALAGMAFHPTAIIFSRWAQQGVLAMMFTLLAAVLAVESLHRSPKHTRALLVIAALSAALAAYSYDPLRLVEPLLIGAFLLAFRRELAALRRSHLAWAAAAFLVIWLPLVVFTVGAGSARLARVSIFREGIAPGIASAVRNYAEHFSPAFWFWQGDLNSRHRLPGTGLVGLGSGILLLAALPVACWEALRGAPDRRRTAALLLAWLLAAPAAAALTNEGIPHALRANLLIPAAPLLLAFLVSDERWASKPRALLAIPILFLAWDAGQALLGVRRLADAPAGVWETGLIEEIAAGKNSHANVYVSAAIPYASYALLFGERINPGEYHERGLEACHGQLVAEPPPLEDGDRFITPPPPGLTDVDLYSESVVVLERRGGVSTARAPRTRIDSQPEFP